MSIASRIESMTTHLQNDYDALESVVGTITEDKNIENIAPILDNLWEELPKVTGTGESLSLATKSGKMKVNLLGNTSQTGTPTPDTPIPINVVSGDNTITISNSDNTQSQTYPINLGTYELCKIGDYQDRLIKTTGKNLFDKDSATYEVGYFDSNGEAHSGGSSIIITSYMPIKPNTDYTLSCNNIEKIVFYNQDKSVASVKTPPTTNVYQINENAYYIRVQARGNTFDLNTIMLNEGSTALPYEPYGTNEWYLEKKIGKVVLDENTNIGGVGYELTNSFRFYTGVIISGQNEEAISNYFKNDTINHINTVDSPALTVINRAQIILRIDKSIATTKEELSTWLGTHNTTVYYVLITPTYTQITGTLKDELEAVWRANSYKNQTNISQVNNDLPFNLDITALEG